MARAASPRNDRSPRRLLAAVEALEDRRLLSASAVTVGGPIVLPPTPVPVTPAPTAPQGYGVTVHAQAGQNFGGYLGVLIGAKAPTGNKIAASVNWGDGTAASAGVVTVSKAGHIDVGGFHTYAAAGDYAITVTITAAPVPVPGQPTPQFILSLGTIRSQAAVTGANATGGVTILEKAGAAFTATVGAFSTIAPATNLKAAINWGDGTTSAGTLTSVGVVGIDVIGFKVDGSHTYAKPGSYAVIVTVTQNFGPPGSQAPTRLVATIHSAAAVLPAAGLNLDGTLTGKASPAPTAADIGALYLLTGSGTAGAPARSAPPAGYSSPGLVATGRATGTLTLTQAAATPGATPNSVTLKLTGPTEKGFGPFPSTLSYVITGGTGADANATGSGTIDSTLGPNGLTFVFVIHSA